MNVVLSELCVFNFYRSLSVIPQKLLRYQLKVIWWGSKFRDDIRLVAIKCFLKFRPSGVEHKAVKNIDNCAMDDLDWHLRKDPSKLVLKYIRCVNINGSDYYPILYDPLRYTLRWLTCSRNKLFVAATAITFSEGCHAVWRIFLLKSKLST